MKQHIKKLSILVTLVFATIFSGCEAEKEYTSKNSLNQNYKLRSVSFSEFKSNRSAFQKLREAREKKNPNILYRGIYNEDYGVFIDTTNIIVIENDGKHSITFQIINETFSNKVENLVLNSKEDGGYVAYITKYLLSEQEIEAINNGNELLSKKPDEIIKLETNNTFKLFFDCISTIEITTVYCKDDKGNLFITEGNLGDCPKPSHTETTKVYVISADCLSSGGGSDGGGNPDGGTIPINPNSSGGGGSNDGSTGNPPNSSGNPSNPNPDINDSNNPIITTPVLPGKSTPKTPCEQLADLLKNEPSAPSTKPNIKPLIQDLMEDAESPINYETAYRFLKDQNGQYSNEWVTPNTNSGSVIPIKAGGNAYGGAHIHTNWLFPMYSWSDVFVLYNMF